MCVRTRGRARMWVDIRVRVRGSEGVQSWTGFCNQELKQPNNLKMKYSCGIFEEGEQSNVCIIGEFS
jgi:hypothetical protein